MSKSAPDWFIKTEAELVLEVIWLRVRSLDEDIGGAEASGEESAARGTALVLADLTSGAAAILGRDGCVPIGFRTKAGSALAGLSRANLRGDGGPRGERGELGTAPGT